MAPDPDPEGRTSAARIRRLVAASPGITRSDLQEEMGLAWSTVCYRVERLVASGHIKTPEENGKNQPLFAADVSPDRMRRWAALSRPGARDVLGLFDAHREVDIPLAMTRTGLSRRVARARLVELEDAGLLERRGSGRPRFALADAPSPRCASAWSPPSRRLAVPA